MRAALLSILILLLPKLAHAQAADAPTPELGARARVKVDRRGESAAASDHRIEVGQLSKVPRTNAQEMLTLAPGVLLTNHGGEGHSAGMFLRGFDAGEGEDLETLLDGVPLNEVSNHHGHGYTDTTFILPELVKELRVVEGPFDPMQGDFAVAGTAEYTLGMRSAGSLTRLSYGRFRRTRLVMAYSPESERRNTFAAIALERGDGFGVNRAFAQSHALGQYEAKLNPHTVLRTLLFVSAQRWDSAGVVRKDEYEARELPCARSRDEQFFCTYDPSQGGSGQRAGLSTLIERSHGRAYTRAQAFAMVRGLRTRENFGGFTLDPRLDGGPQRGDLRDGATDAVTLGARAVSRRGFDFANLPQSAEVGLQARHDLVEPRMDRIRRELNVPYLTDFDRSVRQSHLATFARLDTHVHPKVRLSLGARADAFAFLVVDQNLASEDRIGARLPRESTDAYGFALSPRGTLAWTLLDGLDWMVSAGAGARSSDATALSQSEAAPFARITSAEAGPVLQKRLGTLGVEARASVFYTHVTRDIVFDAEAGRNQPVGPSNRTGGMATSRLKVLGWLDLLGSVAYTRGHLQPRGGSKLEPWSGERIPFLPTWLLRSDAVLEHNVAGIPDLSAYGALGVTYVGRRPLPLAQWAEPYTTLDPSAGARYRFLDLSASLTNALNARYRQAEFHYVSNFDSPDGPRSALPARHFSAGPPIQWTVNLTILIDSETFGGST